MWCGEEHVESRIVPQINLLLLSFFHLIPLLIYSHPFISPPFFHYTHLKMPDVHLFLLIHGLWGTSPLPALLTTGKPGHLDMARIELESAWAINEMARDRRAARLGVGVSVGDCLAPTPPNVDSGASSEQASPALQTCVLPDNEGAADTNANGNAANAKGTSNGTSTRKRPAPAGSEELVVVVAQGMTAKLTYDGVDVCASRVAWEVSSGQGQEDNPGERRHTRLVSRILYDCHLPLCTLHRPV